MVWNLLTTCLKRSRPQPAESRSNVKHAPFLSSRLLSALSLSLCLGATGCDDDEQSPPPPEPPPAIEIVRPESAIEGQYLFVLDEAAVSPDQVKAVAEELLGKHGGTLLQIYDGSILGFQANGLDDAKALAIGADARVKSIGQDGVIQLTATQSNPVWGLDRIDEQARALNKSYEQRATGQGVNVYVIDTGIRATHAGFGGRVSGGMTAVTDGKGTDDCNGHGTHVAGTIGSATWGVAKSVNLFPVRVLGCNGQGTLGGVLAGVDWVTKNHRKPAVANMSLGGSAFPLMDEAVQKSIAAGVVYVLAAGNSNADACTASPARAPEALTVAASNIDDRRASFSNWGSCVDLFAPGQDIPSTWHTGDTAVHTISGTSMAAPHVAGVAAIYLEKNPTASPASVAKALLDGSTANVIQDAKGTPNRLLYSLVVPAPEPQLQAVASPPGYTMMQVAVGSANNVWGLATDGTNWKWNGTGWDKKSCCVTELALAADGTLWATNPPDGNRVLQWDDASALWDAFTLPSGMTHVTVANANTAWGLHESTLYQWANGSWEKKLCCVEQISVGADGALWAVNPPDGNRVLRWTGTEWAFDIPPGMVSISVGSAAHIWAIDPSDNIYQWNGAGWTKKPGALRKISAASDGTVWGLDAAGGVWRVPTP